MISSLLIAPSFIFIFMSSLLMIFHAPLSFRKTTPHLVAHAISLEHAHIIISAFDSRLSFARWNHAFPTTLSIAAFCLTESSTGIKSWFALFSRFSTYWCFFSAERRASNSRA
jgi:hypothetical protein